MALATIQKCSQNSALKNFAGKMYSHHIHRRPLTSLLQQQARAGFSGLMLCDGDLMRDGNLKLSEFRVQLNKAGFGAEFHKGILVCDKGVCLKRGDDDEILIEGPMCPTYYKIRRLLYKKVVFL